MPDKEFYSLLIDITFSELFGTKQSSGNGIDAELCHKRTHSLKIVLETGYIAQKQSYVELHLQLDAELFNSKESTENYINQQRIKFYIWHNRIHNQHSLMDESGSKVLESSANFTY